MMSGGLLVILGSSGLYSLSLLFVKITMYCCIYLKWDGNLSVSSKITFDISFNNFLFKDATDIFINLMKLAKNWLAF